MGENAQDVPTIATQRKIITEDPPAPPPPQQQHWQQQQPAMLARGGPAARRRAYRAPMRAVDSDLRPRSPGRAFRGSTPQNPSTLARRWCRRRRRRICFAAAGRARPGARQFIEMPAARARYPGLSTPSPTDSSELRPGGAAGPGPSCQ